MLKVGVDLSGVITQMKKDKLDKELMKEFVLTHGGKIEDIDGDTDDSKDDDDDDDDNDDDVPLTKEEELKLSKYIRMTKLKIPQKVIINKMKQEGIPERLRNKLFADKKPKKKKNDQSAIIEELGLPKKPQIPKPVNQMKRVK